LPAAGWLPASDFLPAVGNVVCPGAGFGYNPRRMLKALIASLKIWYVGALKTGGYWVVGLMMAIESSIFPLPSEIVIPPAAYWAHTHQIPLSLTGIIIAGTIGSWIGATAMYWASRLAGRPLVLRYGRYVMISQAKVEGAERWAAHYGSMGIFISRLLPVVRHLIGIPAGIVRMDYRAFSLYTVLGSGIWCGVLCWVGIKAGNDEKLMKGEMHAITLWLGGAMVVLGGLYYFFVHRHMKTEQKPASGTGRD
jgi:membrane protein DedA with SNARE-associated domain